jgi:hypothetical protein
LEEEEEEEEEEACRLGGNAGLAMTPVRIKRFEDTMAPECNRQFRTVSSTLLTNANDTNAQLRPAAVPPPEPVEVPDAATHASKQALGLARVLERVVVVQSDVEVEGSVGRLPRM